MIYRFVCGGIVLFWLLMTALLFRSEWWPAYTSLRDVPVEHVVKLLLIHGETSELNILNEKAHLGRLRIHPMIRKSDSARLIEFAGNLQIRIPGPGAAEHRVEREIGRWTRASRRAVSASRSR